MPCLRCGRVQTDPVKGARPWVRAVVEEEQVLICPDCAEEPGAFEDLRACPRCGSTRVSLVMGSLSCRQCGYLEGDPQ